MLAKERRLKLLPAVPAETKLVPEDQNCDRSFNVAPRSARVHHVILAPSVKEYLKQVFAVAEKIANKTDGMIGQSSTRLPSDRKRTPKQDTMQQRAKSRVTSGAHGSLLRRPGSQSVPRCV